MEMNAKDVYVRNPAYVRAPLKATRRPGFVDRRLEPILEAKLQPGDKVSLFVKNMYIGDAYYYPADNSTGFELEVCD